MDESDDTKSPNENLVNLVMASPLLGSIGWDRDLIWFSSSNWAGIFNAMSYNRARSRVLLYDQYKSFPLALWPIVFEKAPSAFRDYDSYGWLGHTDSGCLPNQQEAIYRLLMMRGANDVFGYNADLPESNEQHQAVLSPI
jgi:hypothetical protein